MECCWAWLVKKVEAAEDLDQVIEAHDGFLEQITTQCLLDPDSQVQPCVLCVSCEICVQMPRTLAIPTLQCCTLKSVFPSSHSSARNIHVQAGLRMSLKYFSLYSTSFSVSL